MSWSKQVNDMKPRKAEYGTKNICAANIERIRKQQGMKQTTLISRMQLKGVDINPSSFSKLEGQVRIASDIELKAISEILGTTIEELLTAQSQE
jgi:transcriptional regulator with XRE-family HTH domain